MLKALLVFFITCLFGMPTLAEEGEMLKIKMTFNDKTAIVEMEDNDLVRQFAEMLPAEFEFRDFAGEEKITYFPQPVSLEKTKGGMMAVKGRVFVYAPWKNWGIFYENHSFIPDKNLIPLGKVVDGLENLAAEKTNFKAYIEVLP